MALFRIAAAAVTLAMKSAWARAWESKLSVRFIRGLPRRRGIEAEIGRHKAPSVGLIPIGPESYNSFEGRRRKLACLVGSERRRPCLVTSDPCEEWPMSKISPCLWF